MCPLIVRNPLVMLPSLLYYLLSGGGLGMCFIETERLIPDHLWKSKGWLLHSVFNVTYA